MKFLMFICCQVSFKKKWLKSFKLRLIQQKSWSSKLNSGTINTISRQTNELVLRFTKTHMYLISTTDEGTDDIRIWSEMPTDHLFASYAMEGTSPENDEIYLKLSADLFASALKIHQHAKSLKLKLTQKPSIYFFIEKVCRHLFLPSFMIVLIIAHYLN